MFVVGQKYQLITRDKNSAICVSSIMRNGLFIIPHAKLIYGYSGNYKK